MQAKRRMWTVQTVPDAEPEVAARDPVDPVGLDLEDAFDRLGREQDPISKAAPVREDGHEFGDRPGVAVAIRGRELGAAPGARVDERCAATAGGLLENAQSGIGRRIDVGLDREHVGDARQIRLGETDMEIDRTGLGDLLAEEAAQRSSIDPPHEFAEEPALRLAVIAGSVPGRPARPLRGEALAEDLGLEDLEVVHVLVEDGQPRGVSEHVADEHVLLAGRPELGPDRSDGPVDGQFASVVQDEHTERAHHLGRRPEVHERVPLPWRRARGIPSSAPQIDDEFAPQGDRTRGTEIPLGEVALEGFAHAREGGVAVALDRETQIGSSRHAVPGGAQRSSVQRERGSNSSRLERLIDGSRDPAADSRREPSVG